MKAMVTTLVPHKPREPEVAPLDRVFGRGIGAWDGECKTRLSLATYERERRVFGVAAVFQYIDTDGAEEPDIKSEGS